MTPSDDDDDNAPLPTMQASPGSGPAPPIIPPPMPTDWRYDVRSEIARGGMGRVVEATDNVLGRTVALKEALSIDSDSVKRFQRETRITARLEHPSIVPVHDAGISPTGAPYYVMRKVGGRPLEELVAKSAQLPDRLALVPHVAASAHAIAHAHERGVVHRDIKPSNILVGDLGETIVIDWGLAKALGEPDDAPTPAARAVTHDDDGSLKTRAGVVYGTPGFMAPELLRGRPADERTDVYALGATLYHLLARRPPHHDKNADLIMRAAVDGPPIPLSQLLPSLPPELSTIVEKALAHDPATRYQSARAFAEDLQRFLTGQLVASHHYSPRERLARFVRRNRTAVAVTGAAIAAISLAIVVAFLEIRDERDRADGQAKVAVEERRLAEQQREEVLVKARELTLTNARYASATDPTRAAAMVKPLVATSLWREARDVGAAARANGIAYSLPLSKHTSTLELSRDGERALAAGDDGIVRVIDLRKRSSKEVFNAGGDVMARFADAEHTIVLYQGNRLWILDAASGAKRDVTAPSAIAKLEISGPLVYWVDTGGEVWRLDLAGGPPERVELTEPVSLVAPSPDGRWIAFGGTKHLLLADRSNPTLPPEIITEGVTHTITWSADARRLAAHVDDEVVDVNMQPSPKIFDRFLVGAHFGLAYSGTKIFSSGPTGIRQLSDNKLRLPDPGHTLGVHEGRDRVVISAKPSGEIVVLSEYADHTLEAPAPIQVVATSATGPWIVAAAESKLLVWSLDGFEPRSFDANPPTSARFVTGDTMIVTYFDDSADWIDLRTRKETSLGLVPAFETVTASPDGAEAIAIDSTRHAFHIAGVGGPKPLPGDVQRASYVDDTRLALVADGGVRLDDERQSTHTQLLRHPADARDLVTTSAGGGWIAASFADGLVWRRSLGTSTDSALPLPTPPTGRLPLALGPDGTVYLGFGDELRVWRPDGLTAVIATDLGSLAALTRISPTTLLVQEDDGTAQVVDLDAHAVVSQMPMSIYASVSPGSGLVAAPTTSGGVEILDSLVGWRWPLATPQKGVQQPLSYVEISPDGRRVLGLTQHSVVVWTLDLPGSADDTGTWLDRLTNAVVDRPAGPLGWR